jgi:hypothetical protein
MLAHVVHSPEKVDIEATTRRTDAEGARGGGATPNGEMVRRSALAEKRRLRGPEGAERARLQRPRARFRILSKW